MDLTYSVNTACAVGCGFCPFQRAERPTVATHLGRLGALVAGAPFARRLFLFGGDLAADAGLDALLAGLAALPSRPDVWVYSPLVHPRATARLAGGVARGLVVPFFQGPDGALPFAPPPAAVLRVARGLQRQGLGVAPYLFVLPENAAGLDGLVRLLHRALGFDTLFLRVMNVQIRDERAVPFAEVLPGLVRAAAAARELGVAARFAGDEYPPPCAGGLFDQAPELYAALLPADDGPTANAAVPACADCALARRCRWGYVPYLERFGVDGFRPIARRELPLRHVRELYPDDPSQATAARWYYDPADVPVACTRPWTTLELLSLQPPMAGPCNEDWLKRPLEPLAGGTLLSAWNGPYLRTQRERLAARDDGAVCHAHCSERTRAEGQPLARERVLLTGRAPAFLANRLLQARELLAGAAALASRPTAFSFGPTGRCNHRCVMCHNLWDRDHARVFELPADFYDQIRALLPTLAELHVSGAGEPLVSKPFREFLAGLDATRYPDLRVHLTTNGALLDARLQQRLLAVPFGTLLVSLNAVSAETHRAVCGADDYPRVRANLDALLANRPRFAAGPPAVQLSFVVMRKNVHELPAFLELARDLGCSVRLTAMEPDNLNAAEALPADPAELERALALLAELSATWSRDARIVQYLASVTSTLTTQRETAFVKQVVPPDRG